MDIKKLKRLEYKKLFLEDFDLETFSESTNIIELIKKECEEKHVQVSDEDLDIRVSQYFKMLSEPLGTWVGTLLEKIKIIRVYTVGDNQSNENPTSNSLTESPKSSRTNRPGPLCSKQNHSNPDNVSREGILLDKSHENQIRTTAKSIQPNRPSFEEFSYNSNANDDLPTESETSQACGEAGKVIPKATTSTKSRTYRPGPLCSKRIADNPLQQSDSNGSKRLKPNNENELSSSRPAKDQEMPSTSAAATESSSSMAFPAENDSSIQDEVTRVREKVAKMSQKDFENQTNIVEMLKKRYPNATNDKMNKNVAVLYGKLHEDELWQGKWFRKIKIDPKQPLTRPICTAKPSRKQQNMMKLSFEDFRKKTNVLDLLEGKAENFLEKEKLIRMLFDMLKMGECWCDYISKDLEFKESARIPVEQKSVPTQTTVAMDTVESQTDPIGTGIPEVSTSEDISAIMENTDQNTPEVVPPESPLNQLAPFDSFAMENTDQNTPEVVPPESPPNQLAPSDSFAMENTDQNTPEVIPPESPLNQLAPSDSFAMENTDQNTPEVIPPKSRLNQSTPSNLFESQVNFSSAANEMDYELTKSEPLGYEFNDIIEISDDSDEEDDKNRVRMNIAEINKKYENELEIRENSFIEIIDIDDSPVYDIFPDESDQSKSSEHISQVVPSAEMIIEVSTEPYIAPVKHDIVAPVDSEIMGATDSVSQQTLSVASETPVFIKPMRRALRVPKYDTLIPSMVNEGTSQARPIIQPNIAESNITPSIKLNLASSIASTIVPAEELPRAKAIQTTVTKTGFIRPINRVSRIPKEVVNEASNYSLTDIQNPSYNYGSLQFRSAQPVPSYTGTTKKQGIKFRYESLQSKPCSSHAQPAADDAMIIDDSPPPPLQICSAQPVPSTSTGTTTKQGTKFQYESLQSKPCSSHAQPGASNAKLRVISEDIMVIEPSPTDHSANSVTTSNLHSQSRHKRLRLSVIRKPSNTTTEASNIQPRYKEREMPFIDDSTPPNTNTYRTTKRGMQSQNENLNDKPSSPSTRTGTLNVQTSGNAEHEESPFIDDSTPPRLASSNDKTTSLTNRTRQ